MNIYEVIPDGYYMRTTDFEEEDRRNMNLFFKENYKFEFKDIYSKTFEVQLRNALYASNRNVDIIITMARTVLHNKNNPNWKEVINYF